MKIAIGGDHSSLALKTSIINHLKQKGVVSADLGTYTEESTDYPIYAKKVSDAVLSGEANFGILVCGTGVGMSIAANKIKGIRCALCGDTYSAKMTRLHNDANVLALGARVLGEDVALEIADAFLENSFCGEPRHINRLNMVKELENA
ncbi:MAG: ribose 5-phosphate isomerase B [Oscillospiraceae bacterium]|nr:ribose 5-phosphate isomerase B [Oscillospiraceae bacterium]